MRTRRFRQRFVANYTQISGTSMAAPHIAGVVANILQANPSLLARRVRSVIERTATPMAAYDEFEVGAGMANVHAAVDLAFNPQKPYGNFGFTGKGLTLTQADGMRHCRAALRPEARPRTRSTFRPTRASRWCSLIGTALWRRRSGRGQHEARASRPRAQRLERLNVCGIRRT